jgi:hypothetical protein
MGCGCGGGRHKERDDARQQTKISRVKQSIKKAWEKTQPEPTAHVVKRINKKI